MNRDLRERISEHLDAVEDEAIVTLIKESLSAEKEVWATVKCKHCSREGKYTVPVPNWRERAQVLQILADQSKGKPAEEKRVVVDITARRLEDLRSLSDRELAEILDAEILPELPPAA